MDQVIQILYLNCPNNNSLDTIAISVNKTFAKTYRSFLRVRSCYLPNTAPAPAGCSPAHMKIICSSHITSKQTILP